jgi:hypothetical protein
VSVITERERAERLARAILADVRLYHETEIREHSPKVHGALQEGRELFQQRVDPSLHGVFDTEIANAGLTPWGAPLREPYRDKPPSAPPPPRERNTTIPVFVAVVILAVGATLVAILNR